MTDRTVLQQNLKRLLDPKRIAYVGGRTAAGTLERCRKMGFTGELWQVNPRAPDPSRHVYESIEALPCPPDAAYLAVSTEKTIETVAQLSQRGAGGCVCYAAGFSEMGGDGIGLQAALVKAAGNMALVGPNCYGLVEYRRRVHLWTGETRVPFDGPGVAIVSQSGALAEFMTMEQRSVPIVSVVSVGNEAVVSLEDVIECLLDDDDIKAIGLYVEGLSDVQRFAQLAIAALQKRKPITVIKVGRSDAGQKITAGHTSSLAGAAELYDALFERLGIAVSYSLSDFLERLKLLCHIGPLAGNRVASVTCSGGQAAMLADRAEFYGLEFPPLSDNSRTLLEEKLPRYVNVMNPLDTTVGPINDREQMRVLFDAMAANTVDVITAALDSYEDEDAPFGDEMIMILEELSAAAQQHSVPGIANSALVEGLPRHMRERALAEGLVPILGSEELLSAISAGVLLGRTRQQLENSGPRALELATPVHLAGETVTLSEHAAKQRISGWGLPVPQGAAVSAQHAISAANDIGYPVVLKALHPTLTHKSDDGAVIGGLYDDAALAGALQEMTARLSVVPDRFLVETFVDDSVAEFIVGVKHDPQFGHAVVIGSGGVLVELLMDSAVLLLPCTRSDIERKLDELQSAPLLAGFRGKPRGDRGALIDCIELVAKRVLNEGHGLVELDLNPVLVRPQGAGVMCVDALLTVNQ